MKANHNTYYRESGKLLVVSNGSKILKWKQITTSNEDGLLDVKLFLMVQRY